MDWRTVEVGASIGGEEIQQIHNAGVGYVCVTQLKEQTEKGVHFSLHEQDKLLTRKAGNTGRGWKRLSALDQKRSNCSRN